VTKPLGKVNEILPETAKGDEVLKENVAVCEGPTAADIAAVGFDTMFVHDAVNGFDAALNPCFVILIVLKALSIPDNGTKL